MSSFGHMLSCMFYRFVIHFLDKEKTHLLCFFLPGRKIIFAICVCLIVECGSDQLVLERNVSNMMLEKVSFLDMSHILID